MSIGAYWAEAAPAVRVAAATAAAAIVVLNIGLVLRGLPGRPIAALHDQDRTALGAADL
jgi:hypothetical protein